MLSAPRELEKEVRVSLEDKTAKRAGARCASFWGLVSLKWFAKLHNAFLLRLHARLYWLRNKQPVHATLSPSRYAIVQNGGGRWSGQCRKSCTGRWRAC